MVGTESQLIVGMRVGRGLGSDARWLAPLRAQASCVGMLFLLGRFGDCFACGLNRLGCGHYPQFSARAPVSCKNAP